MHLPDAYFLPTPTGVALVVAGGVISGVGLVAGGRAMSAEETTRTGMITAFVFVASLVHVTIPPTSVHLGLYGLAGILLGRRIWLVGPIALGLQAVMFGHGGIAAIGLNALNLSAGALAGRAVFALRPANATDGRTAVAAFAAGFTAIAVVVGAVVAELLAVGAPLVLAVALPAWLATAALEGIVTAVAIGTLHRSFPELLPRTRDAAPLDAPMRAAAGEAPA